MRTLWLKTLTLAAVISGSAGRANANFTAFKAPPALEASQEQILEHTYGVNFHKVGDDYYSGTITAKRVDDNMTFTGPMASATGHIGDATDQTWSGNTLKAKTLASFSYNTQQLGYFDTGSYQKLFDVTGYGYQADGTGVVNMRGKDFNWGREGNSGLQSSLNAFNLDRRDHMVTYELEGLSNQSNPIWVMFWEDLDLTSNLPVKRSWADYNDLAVQIEATSPIPLPAAAWPGLLTLGLIGSAVTVRRVRTVAANAGLRRH